MPTFTLAPRRRRLVGAVGATAAGALVAATLTVAPAAQAATPVAPSLTWNVSENFVRHLFFSYTSPGSGLTPTGTVSGGATITEGTAGVYTDDYFTFPGAGVTTAADGTVTRSYAGTVRGAFVAGGSEQYSVTIADPKVTVAPDGTGTLSATVSSTVGATTSTPAVSVKVVDFAGATGSTLSGVTPNWANVLPAGSPEAAALGISDPTLPLGGKSFRPEFLGALDGGIRAHFYASGTDPNSAANLRKPPGALSANGPTATATVTSSSYAGGVTVKVDGVGFHPTTTAGDNGVYAMLAPADMVIDYSDMSGTVAAAAAAAYVTPGQFAGGDSFSTSMNAPTSKLDPTKQYAVFTWQAHTHSNPGQDTKTPVTIDWSTLTAPPVTTTPTPTPTVTAPVATESTAVAKVKKAKLGKKVTAKVTIKGQTTVPTGKVTVTLKKGKKTVKAKSATLDAQGKAKVKLAKLKKAGKYKVVVKYAGDDTNKAVKKVTKFKVKG